MIEDAAQAIGHARDPNNIQIGQMGCQRVCPSIPPKTLAPPAMPGPSSRATRPWPPAFSKTRQHGETARYHHSFVGGNFRMDALQAAVLTVKLKHLTKWNQQRQAIAAYYTSRFAGTDILPARHRP